MSRPVFEAAAEWLLEQEHPTLPGYRIDVVGSMDGSALFAFYPYPAPAAYRKARIVKYLELDFARGLIACDYSFPGFGRLWVGIDTAAGDRLEFAPDAAETRWRTIWTERPPVPHLEETCQELLRVGELAFGTEPGPASEPVKEETWRDRPPLL